MSEEANPVCPLVGPNVGVLMPIFWTRDNPKYYEWGCEAIEGFLNYIDHVVAITDDSVPVGQLPVETVHLNIHKVDHIARCFQLGVHELQKRRVGTFFYAGADDLFNPPVLKQAFELARTEADIVGTKFARVEDRSTAFVASPFPEPRYIKRLPVGGDHPLNCTPNEYWWPESSVYRTSLFLAHPVEPERRFIRGSVTRAADKGSVCLLALMEDVGFYYFQHGQGDTGQGGEEPKAFQQ